jgi:hypothetical protein
LDVIGWNVRAHPAAVGSAKVATVVVAGSHDAASGHTAFKLIAASVLSMLLDQ